MNHRRVLVLAVGATVLVVGGLLGYLLSSPHASVAWARAITLRSAPALRIKSGEANLLSLSCSSVGNCSAVGGYALDVNHSRAIVVDEQDGRWGNVEALRGLSARGEGINTAAFAVSCPSTGNCSAGGTYSVGAYQLLIFVANERDGVWGRARTIPDVGALETGDFATLSTISCATSGNCSAGGEFAGVGGSRAYVLDEVRGTWGSIHPVSGPPAYSMVGSVLSSISCSSPGDCSAVGSNPKGSHGLPFFAVNETNGVWGRAEEVRGLAALSPGGSDYEGSLSCGSAGDCGARGIYRAGTGVTQSFLVVERHGVWGRAFNIPGIVALDGRHIEQLSSISCGAPGDCSAGGAYGNGSHERAFLVNEVNGRWGTPMSIPGLAALNRGLFTSVDRISCSSSDDCGVIGSYSGKGGYSQSFALNETNGTWGVATKIGASSFPGAVGAQTNAISCASSSGCSVVGVVFSSMTNGSLYEQSTRPDS